jgi:hypothetical protein
MGQKRRQALNRPLSLFLLPIHFFIHNIFSNINFQLDGQFPSKCNGIDAALFSPSQQSRGGGGGDEASEEIGQIVHNSGTNESAAKLLASAFLLDQQQQQATTKGGHSKNNGRYFEGK